MAPILRGVHLASVAPLIVSIRAGRVRRYTRWPRTAARFASLILLVMITAHVTHLPVMAFEGHVGVAAPRSALHDNHPAAMDHAQTVRTTPSGHGDDPERLIGQSDADVDCMAAEATLPTRASTTDMLTLPVSDSNAVEAESFDPAAIIHSAESTRRHLLLQVLLR
jgi:hypothetical protein